MAKDIDQSKRRALKLQCDMKKTSSLFYLVLTAHSAVAFGPTCLFQNRRRHLPLASSITQETESTIDVEAAPFVWSKQWYPVFPLAHLENIGNKPVAFKVLGRNLVLFEHAPGSIAVFSDECPHRHAPLSTGKVVGCSLMCRFHGWQFDKDGSCVSIPMFPGSDSEREKLQKRDAFSVASYPTRRAGGLLWVCLDRESPPDLSPEVLVPESIAEKAEWMVQTFPVSYISMVENSLDPTHAPFIHQGVKDFNSGESFSPDGATPMKRFELLGPSTINGFTLEHSPYQKNSNVTVQRQFLPPCLQKTSLPGYDIYLYFLPTGLRETKVMSLFPLPSIKFMERFPSRMLRAVLDVAHYLYYTSDGAHRFFLQDSLTMVGQDSRKLHSTNGDASKVVLDLAPSPADVGIKTFQRWLRKFGHGGPFSDPTAVIDSITEPRFITLWDNHGKNCPRCQRMLARAKLIEKLSHRLKGLTLFCSVTAGFIQSFRGSKMIFAWAGLLVSLMFLCLERMAVQIYEKLHRRTNIPEIDVSDVYAY